MHISPDVLQAAAADSASPAWKTVWAQCCHQGTCDPASAALLPWLASTIAGFVSAQREMPLSLAGLIAADATDADRASYSMRRRSGPYARLRSNAYQMPPTMPPSSIFSRQYAAWKGMKSGARNLTI